MISNPYDVRAIVFDAVDPNTLVLEVETKGDETEAAVWMDFYLASSDPAITGPESGHTYTCRVYEYGSGVPVDEATTTV